MLSIYTSVLFFLIQLPSLTISRTSQSIQNSPSKSSENSFDRKLLQRTLDMDELCGKIIRLNGDTFPGTYFHLTSGKYSENFHCILTIQAATRSQRIIIVMDKMDVTCGDQLLFYDGQIDQKFLLNQDPSSQCGGKNYYFRVNDISAVYRWNDVFFFFLSPRHDNRIKWLSNFFRITMVKSVVVLLWILQLIFVSELKRIIRTFKRFLIRRSCRILFTRWESLSMSKWLLYFESIPLR